MIKKNAKPAVSYRNSYLDKPKPQTKKVSNESKIQEDEGKGVIKKFINFDDIPDFDELGSSPNSHSRVGEVNSRVHKNEKNHQNLSRINQPAAQYDQYDDDEEEYTQEDDRNSYNNQTSGYNQHSNQNNNIPNNSQNDSNYSRNATGPVKSLRSPKRPDSGSNSCVAPSPFPSDLNRNNNNQNRNNASYSTPRNGHNDNNSSNVKSAVPSLPYEQISAQKAQQNALKAQQQQQQQQQQQRQPQQNSYNGAEDLEYYTSNNSSSNHNGYNHNGNNGVHHGINNYEQQPLSPPRPIVFAKKLPVANPNAPPLPHENKNYVGTKSNNAKVGNTDTNSNNTSNNSGNNMRNSNDSGDNNKELTEADKLHYSKQPRPVNFKPYTLKEYNIIKPKGYVVIESLKPDLNTDELIAKRNNLERIKQFSKNLTNYNKEALTNQRKLPSAAEKHDIEISNKKLESKQAKAKEFSKNIPKPSLVNQQAQGKDTRNNKQGGAKDWEDCDDDSLGDNFDHNGDHFSSQNNQKGGRNATFNSSNYHNEDDEMELKLQQLTAKHNQSKAAISNIKKTFGI